MIAFTSRKQELVGLDIGSHSVKLVELSESKGSYRLKNFAMVNLPQDVIVDGTVMDSGAIIDVLKDLISRRKLRNRKVAISVSGFSVIIKKIAVAMMSEEELLESIQWEAAQYIPFEIEDVNIDFQILGQNRENPDQMDVLLVAAKRETISDYENLILGAGLELQLIDVDSFAVETMYENLFGIGDEEVIALVNLGASTTNVNIVKGPISLYTKDVPLGGKQLTQEIQRQYGMSFEEAENLKVGGPELWASHRNVEKIISNYCENFASEIQRSLDLFYATYPEEQIQRIGLCGGGAMTPGLLDQVRERMGLEVQLLNPFEKISYPSKEYEESYMNSVGPMAVVGVGLAMRKVGDR